MRRLPLYSDRKAPIDRAEPLLPTPGCVRCERHESARSVCIQADVGAGTNPEALSGSILVVSHQPTKYEDDTGRPMSSHPNRSFREELEGRTKLPIVYKTALSCWAPQPKQPVTLAGQIDACRGYVRAVIDQAKPSRVLCLGKEAYQSVLGVKVPSTHARQGYGYLEDGTPVFILPAWSSVMGNRFLYARAIEDLEWALTASPQPPPYDLCVEVIETVEDACEAVGVLAASECVVYDTEFWGVFGTREFSLECLAASPKDGSRVFGWEAPSLRDERADALKELLRSKPLRGHGLKADQKAVARGLGLIDEFGRIQLGPADADTMLWAKQLDSDMLVRLGYQDVRVGMGGHKEEMQLHLARARTMVQHARAEPDQPWYPTLVPTALDAAVKYPHAPVDSFAYGCTPKDVTLRYCAMDTVSTARLGLLFEPQIKSSPAHELMSSRFVCPSVNALAQVETWGMAADVQAARVAGKMLGVARDAALTQLRELGCMINVNSNVELARYLYQDLGLPVLDTTATGAPSTAASTLKRLDHPVVEPLLRYAKTDKLISTYVDGLIPFIVDGRIYGNIKQDGTRSGRWSSFRPNLQNIPSRGPLAKVIKGIFVAPPGHCFVQLDYSQLELRVAAILTGDPALIQIYKDGLDLHLRTAQMISQDMWGIAPEQVGKDERGEAKAVGFGLWYGKGDRTLASDLNTTVRRAKMIRELVLGQFPTASAWIEARKAFTLEHGVTWTYWDGQRARCRQLPDILSSDSGLQSKASNASFNSAVQGSAALFMERTIQAVVEWLRRDRIPARVTNTVHDSIILEVPFPWVYEVVETVRDIMQSWPTGDVPLIADADVGLTWANLHDYDTVLKVGGFLARGISPEEICHILELTTKDGAPDLKRFALHRQLFDLFEGK
jgi:uracil-DNA glycosylase family 4